MMPPCPDPLEFARLLDGETTENRAAEIRAHVAACTVCAAEIETQRRLVARLSAPIPGAPTAGAVDRVMRRLDAAPAEAPSSSRWRAWALSASALAAVAVLVVWVVPRGPSDRGRFAPRGSGTARWAAKVGIDLWALEAIPRKLDAGSEIGAGAALVAGYANASAAPAYLLAFALDARGRLHWLYPGWQDPGADPASVRLEPSAASRALPESVMLDDVEPGVLRCVFVVSHAALHVSSVEALSPSERTAAALRARWPEARVDEVLLTVRAPGEPQAVKP